MSSNLPKAPADLTPESADWFARIVREYQVCDEPGVLHLTQALRAYDRANQARETLANEGLMVKDRLGNTRPHPAATIEVNSTRNFLSCMKALGLDMESTRPTPGRPPKR
jgi:P27 family predicted phage terminase small subunit